MLRPKRLKNVTVDAAECVKIADIFAGGGTVASMFTVTVMLQQQHVEGEEAVSRDRGSQRCRLLTGKPRDRVSGKVQYNE